MREKLVTRVFCDHCGKGGFQKPSMLRHEGVCYHNPKRGCPECEDQVSDVAENVKVLGEQGLAALKDKVHGCPACTLAAVIQHNKRESRQADCENPAKWVQYDTYKDDLAEWRSARYREESNLLH